MAGKQGGPLAGLRVLEFTTDVAGPFATRLLAEYGADVMKVEPPGGDRSRRHGPFKGNTEHIEGSGRFLFLNMNKRGIVLDLDAASDLAVARELAAAADVVVEDFEPGRMAHLGMGYEALSAQRAGAVLVSITPWGQDGPYAGLRMTDLVAQAMGGPMLWTGSANREPLRVGGGGAVALYHAGSMAALAAMTALHRRDETGEGDHIDLSIYETQVGTRDRSAPYLQNFIYNGTEPRRQLHGTAFANGIRPCADGYVHINVSPNKVRDFLRMIERPDLADDPGTAGRIGTVEFFEEVEGAYAVWLLERSKTEVVEAAQRARLLAGAINTLTDLVKDAHFQARGFWETVADSQGGSITVPGHPFRLPASPPPPLTRAPRLDEHGVAIRAEAAALTVEPVRVVTSAGPGRLPLEGVRVGDITLVWAGPHATQLLADWGAEVIRVEPITRIQPQTRWGERKTSREEEMHRGSLGIASRGGFPNAEPGSDPWNRNSGFNSHARNKRSMACDVMTQEGRDHFLRLIETCDVFVENNIPETIAKAKITYEDLVPHRQDLVMVSMPAYGLSGPYSWYRSHGTQLEGTIGHTVARGYVDGPPDQAGDAYTADAFAGVHAALAVLMALRHRRLTGQGQHIELAQADNFLPVLAELILDVTMNGKDLGPWGNRHRRNAPHGVYPCIGDDEWIAIECEDDDDFARLCATLDLGDLGADVRFATAGARMANAAELDRRIAERTRAQEKWALFRKLQAAGIATGPLQRGAERIACPQLTHRGFFQPLENASTGRHLYAGPAWKMTSTPNPLRRAPVRLGEDNEYVYRQLLGLSAEEYERLLATGAVGTAYAPGLLARAHA